MKRCIILGVALFLLFAPISPAWSGKIEIYNNYDYSVDVEVEVYLMVDNGWVKYKDIQPGSSRYKDDVVWSISRILVYTSCLVAIHGGTTPVYEKCLAKDYKVGGTFWPHRKFKVVISRDETSKYTKQKVTVTEY